MRQVLFHIPFTFFGLFPDGIPIYGFGMMLFAAFLVCTWLASRRAQKDGMPKEAIQDLAIWLFMCGIVGARAVFMLVERKPANAGQFFREFFRIWDGGLVYYGSLLGGIVGFCLAYFFVMRPRKLLFWGTADVIAPAAALGLCLGRVGCLLNGCCYGEVACPHCYGVDYPLPAAPRLAYTEAGLQTGAGFTLSENFVEDERAVAIVAPGSAAEGAGLLPGDVIVAANGQAIGTFGDLDTALRTGLPRGQNELSLTVKRGAETVALRAFEPRTLRLYPTQVYESISCLLLFFLLSAFYPFRPRYGAVMVLFLLLYPVHRYLDEMLRNDTEIIHWDMTLSQLGSLAVFAMALVFAVIIAFSQRRPVPGPA
jgi:phosphatidylglycerol:prolipoprotein diacylglycerol transferase